MLIFIPYQAALGFIVFSYLPLLPFCLYTHPVSPHGRSSAGVIFILEFWRMVCYRGRKDRGSRAAPQVRASWSTGCPAGFGSFLYLAEAGLGVTGEVAALLEFSFVLVCLLAPGL